MSDLRRRSVQLQRPPRRSRSRRLWWWKRHWLSLWRCLLGYRPRQAQEAQRRNRKARGTYGLTAIRSRRGSDVVLLSLQMRLKSFYPALPVMVGSFLAYAWTSEEKVRLRSSTSSRRDLLMSFPLLPGQHRRACRLPLLRRVLHDGHLLLRPRLPRRRQRRPVVERHRVQLTLQRLLRVPHDRDRPAHSVGHR